MSFDDIDQKAVEACRPGGGEVFWFQETDSTSTRLREKARKLPVPTGTVAIADSQTGGRGRSGRVWYSPPGENIYLSVLLRPVVPADTVPLITFAAGLACAETVEKISGLSPGLKWPNDIFLEGKKAGGILSEAAYSGGELRYVVVGVGLNVNSEQTALERAVGRPVTSLRSVAGRIWSRTAILCSLMNGLWKWIQKASEETAAGGDAVADFWIEQWRRYDMCKGRPVRVSGPGGRTLAGRAEGVADDGGFLVRDAGGVLRHVVAGEVLLESIEGENDDYNC